MDIVTVREAAKRLYEDGIYVSQYAIRKFIAEKAINVVKVGNKSLIYYPTLKKYITGRNMPVKKENAE